MKKFDPTDVSRMLGFVELLVEEFSKIKEPHKVEIDGNPISFASHGSSSRPKTPDNKTAHFRHASFESLRAMDMPLTKE